MGISLNLTVVFPASGAIFVCENEPESAISIKTSSLSDVASADRAEREAEVSFETSSEGIVKERDALCSSD
ncbi:MAG: hypothetical protein IJ158_10590 [Treponema sp.]|nr:hypothetical protein [Treponema sp.]